MNGRQMAQASRMFRRIARLSAIVRGAGGVVIVSPAIFHLEWMYATFVQPAA